MKLIPIHLYSNKKLCILSYKKIDYLPLANIYYVTSPNSLPLPKNIQMYYTLVSKQYPFALEEIRKFKDPYDFDNIYKLSDKLQTQRLGVIFGLPIKETKNMIKLFAKQNNKNLVLSTQKNNKSYNFLTSSNNIVTSESKNIKENNTVLLVVFFFCFIVFCLIIINFFHPIFS